ncbi:MAG: SDR family NAD(P)-dependent oxidoreductase [Steroidobacteraceae bacterium]
MTQSCGRLEGVTALVTGAARMRGIGRAIAVKLATDGAHVVVASLPRQASAFPEHEQACGWRGIESVAEEIRALGRQALSVDCDVTQADQVENLFELAERQLGTVHAIINNAGVAGGAGSAAIADLDYAEWQRTIDVNLNGVFLVSKRAARGLIAAGKPGAIVNLSSLAGRVGMAWYGGYCASKFAVIGLTQQMALELARNSVRVNCVCPGTIDTDMMDGTFARMAGRIGKSSAAQIKESVARSVPLRRQGMPQELAAVISFLLGPEASYITGQTINVDGGVRMD